MIGRQAKRQAKRQAVLLRQVVVLRATSTTTVGTAAMRDQQRGGLIIRSFANRSQQ